MAGDAHGQGGLAAPPERGTAALPVRQPDDARRRQRQAERRRVATGLLFISPWLAGFLLLTLYPVLATLYYSFTEYRVLSPPRWVGFRNYAELFTDQDYFLPALLNTLFMFIELPIATVLSVGIAILLNQRVRGIGLFRTLYYLPSVVPVVASSILWMWMLNPEYGLVNQTLKALHLPPRSGCRVPCGPSRP